MKILVAIKRVVDYNIKVRIKPDGSNVDIDGVKMSINPFDENAIEEAVRLKEKGIASEIVVVSLGGAANQDVLRHALAMGADRAILVESDQDLQPLAVSKLLKSLVDREQPALTILGKQAIDDDAGQTGQMLAALLDYPQATFTSTISINGNEVVAIREVDGGTETIGFNLPAVITADLRLNEPRFVKLPNLMMARKKSIETINATDLGVDTKPRLQLLKVSEPPARKSGIKVGSVQELLAKLRAHEGIQL
ncbi:electron transfer flavoprotein subunit beta/FixA family protein [Methylotenera mobilis]|jgi:electron transfer flavoprotein beta subunit|uniref:electron transfer flavoprotein subunit beta/FixA family protein n=1 Tax=Methylotenera mobilis TaxID=359408 RepID=UPI000373EE4A|nr:electron transfer flavoprotein subunit beta/FixA family protein [Methylotenera mobilis]PPC97274.1 MAG: electron transfer flavoprotein subunit beta/FixA family protein [Methylotenera sp.]